jgi:zinc protease
VIAGQFDEAKALAYVAETCGAIPRPARKLDATYTVEPVQDGERYVELRRVGDNPEIMMVWHAPALSNQDSAALEVLSGIMSGGGGRGGGGTGRLYKALVDNKKALSARMGYEELHDPGFVLVQATLSKDQSIGDARKTIVDTVASIVSEPPSKDEVEREKTRIVQSMEQRMTNTQQTALGLSDTIASGDWRLFFLNYDQLKAVTPEDVVRVGKLYFKASNRTVGEFIPTADPDRTEVPAGADLAKVFQSYKSSLDVSAGEAFDPTPANIEKHLIRSKLGNGLKVVMLPKATRGDTVIASLRVHFGDLNALMGKDATGSMAGALLMRGTTTRTRQQIQDEMVKLNARINVSGNVEGASATIQTKAENLVAAMQLAADILRNPSFPDSDFEQIRKQRIAGVENRRTDPGAKATLELERTLNPYPRKDPRYSGTPDEDIEDTGKVTLDDVKAFYSKFYGASHGELVIVGQFDMTAASKAAADLFGDWKSPSPFQRITTAYQKTGPVNTKIETPDKKDATFSAGVLIPMGDSDPDYPAMVLANFIFGGSITSRMEDRIRNREGLSYGASSGFSASVEGTAAIFQARATSNPKNTPKVEASFRDELAKTVAGGFTAKEIEEAKKSIHDQRTVGRSQDQQLLTLIGSREEYGRTLDWDTQMDAKLAALTVDQVNAALKRHLDPAAITIVKAGDFKSVGAYTE